MPIADGQLTIDDRGFRREPSTVPRFSRSPLSPTRRASTAHRQSSRYSEDRGAALIIAVAVFTILFAIGLTFLTVSRVELKVSTNVTNTVRADLLADAATSIAIGFLNHDLALHPTVTSLDHAWRTYFNGAWIEGKDWAFRDPSNPSQVGTIHLENGAIPNNVDFVRDGLRDNLYTPRRERGTTPVPSLIGYGSNNPFLIDTVGYDSSGLPPAHQVHTWADVDNDGDGLRDSVWLPLVADTSSGAAIDRYDPDPTINTSMAPQLNRQLAGIANILEPGDGADNDLDDNLPMHVDTSTDSTWSKKSATQRTEEATAFFRSTGTDEANETEIFLYWGGNDGRDNNADGRSDDDTEQRWYLTSPLYAPPAKGATTPVYLQLDNVALPSGGPGSTNYSIYSITCGPADGWVDAIDNDYDFVNNNHIDYWTPLAYSYGFDLDAYIAAGKPMYRSELTTDPAIYKALVNWPSAWDLETLDPKWRTKAVYQPQMPADAAFASSTIQDNNGVDIPVDGELFNYLRDINQWNNTSELMGHAGLGTQMMIGKAMPNLWPSFEFDKIAGAQEIAPKYLQPNGTAEATYRVKSTGEPACELVGRAAILVNDEASKANLNIAGGFSFDAPAIQTDPANATNIASALFPAPADWWCPAFGSGVTPSEYSTLYLPSVQVRRAHKLWNLTMGDPFGSLKQGKMSDLSVVGHPDLPNEYIPDAVLPGYGFVDDDGDALALAMDGLDNNGNGLVDEGLNTGVNLSPEQQAAAIEFGENHHFWTGIAPPDDAVQLVYQKYLGYLEGIDEPGEFQRRRPLRNLVAEGRTPKSDLSYEATSVDGSGAVGAFGQLGDHILKTRDETARILRNEAVPTQYSLQEYQNNFFENLKSLVTLHSTDSNNRFRQAEQVDSVLSEPTAIWSGGQRPHGLRLDYNFATPEQIAQVLRDDWGMASPAPYYGTRPEAPFTAAVPKAPLTFARGLQMEGVSVTLNRQDDSGTGEWKFENPAALQLDDPLSVGNRVHKADPYLRALQLGVNLRDARDAGYSRSTATMEIDDLWWDTLQADYWDDYPRVFGDASASTPDSGEHRKIIYTVGGNEGIRITELMVRPVRRIEAEMERLENPGDLTTATKPFLPRYLEDVFGNFLVAGNPPGFDMRRMKMDDRIKLLDPGNTRYSLDPPPANGYWPEPMVPTTTTGSTWPDNPCNGSSFGGGNNPGWFGAGAALATQTRLIPLQDRNKDSSVGANDAPTEHWPNVMEFTFGPSVGLPPGRYYLKMNTTDYRGRPTVNGIGDQVTNTRANTSSPWYNGDPIRIALKYCSSSGNYVASDWAHFGTYSEPTGNMKVLTIGATSISEDLAAGFAGFTTNPDDFYSTVSSNPSWGQYWTHYWRGPSDHYPSGGVGPVLEAQSLDKADQTAPTGQISLAEARTILPLLPERLFRSYDKNGDGFFDLASEGLPCFNPLVATGNGIATGWMFVPSLDDEVVLPPTDLAAQATSAQMRAGYGQDEGFTVMIPPYAANAADQVYLHIAVCMGGIDPIGYAQTTAVSYADDDPNEPVDAKPRLSINSFEFSQEPDLEWIEIENTTQRPIDIAGWDVAVGGIDPKTKEVVTDDRIFMRVPSLDVWGNATMTLGPATPEGSAPVSTASPRMILAVSAYDFIGHEPDTNHDRGNLLFRNGIGMEGGMIWGVAPQPIYDGECVTVPPFPIPPYNADGSPLTDPVPMPGSKDFFEVAAQALGNPHDTYELFRRDPVQLPVVQLDITGLTEKDAIRVPRRNPVLGSENVNEGLANMAFWVLRGGVFPNNPEHDGVDNDNDNAILTADEVDNNGDGVCDAPYEGIDEGRYWMDATQEWAEPGIFWPIPAPGAFDAPSVHYLAQLAGTSTAMLDANTFDSTSLTFNATTSYLGETKDPPRWKEFVERRFFPGDNVVISLFEGDHQRGRVVDRVTYNERDVINRAIDDAVRVPHDYGAANPLLPTLFDKSWGVLEDDHYVTWWPDNTMGADFYRTLERKHTPMYNGDRFGTSNRWEATDGNYDDWSHDPVLVQPLDGAYPTLIADPYDPSIPVWPTDGQLFCGTPLEPNAAYDPEFDFPVFYYPESDEGVWMLPVTHTVWDTSDEYAARPAALKLGRKTIEFNNAPMVSVADVMTLPYFEVYENAYLTVDTAQYIQLPFEMSDFLGAHAQLVVPGLSREQPLRVRLGQSYPNATTDYWCSVLAHDPSAPPSPDYNQRALMGAAAFDPVRLTCARADFYLMRPGTSVDTQALGLRDWIPPSNPSDASALWSLPQVWRPVFLYPMLASSLLDKELNDTEYNLGFPYRVANNDGAAAPLSPLSSSATSENYFLFKEAPVPTVGDVTANSLWSRSPVQSRTALYISGNPAATPSWFAFDSTWQVTSARPGRIMTDGKENPDDLEWAGPPRTVVSEALFVWNADDGLEDGVYDLYIDTGRPFDGLLAADQTFAIVNPGQTLLTDLGRALCQIGSTVSPSDVVMDAEVFTDRNRDGKCWPRASAGPSRENLLRKDVYNTETPPAITVHGDSFGMKEGLTPDENGMMYYGTVQIENNYLALNLRNWSRRGVPCTFAGVVLTPRDRTSGRININTVETRAYKRQGETEWRPFNALMGLPGLRGRQDDLRQLPTSEDFENMTGRVLATTATGLPDLGRLPITEAETIAAVSDRVKLMVAGRPGTFSPGEHPDGRYYETLDELIMDTNSFKADTPGLASTTVYPLTTLGLTTAQDAREHFERIRWRLSHMANLITMRSDVFEIIATVQAGYAVDENGNGEINWRSNDEFVVTAEKKIRTIYER